MDVNKLKGYRTMAGLTQREMAKEIKMAESTYINKELGKSQFSLEEARKIVAVLEKNKVRITLEDFF